MEEALEKSLATQIPEYDEAKESTLDIEEPAAQEEQAPAKGSAQYLGQRLGYTPGKSKEQTQYNEADKTLAERKNLSRVGENILTNKRAEIREGYVPVNRGLLGERDAFYPEGWSFKIKPADVEAIRNWSTLDNDSANSIDDVFNEILKYCLAIEDANGRPIPWHNIYSWDRFFFVLLIREYTFARGESKIEWTEDCVNCDSSVKFSLTSQSLMYDLPDADLIKNYFDRETQSWLINPADFGVDHADVIELHLPTLEKDANIKAWMIDKLQQNRNAKIDSVFIKFLPWLAPKISKDITIAQRQIRQYEQQFKLWDVELFAFMDNVLKNVIVTPATKIRTFCDSCGEEVTSDIRFPNGVSALFAMENKFKKFGSK